MVSPTFVVLGGQKVSKFKSLLLMFGTLILLSGCSNIEVFNAKGPVASSQKFLIIYSIIFMLVIVAVVLTMFAVLFSSIVTIKMTNRKMHHNSLIETIWFVVPILIVIALAIPTVKTLYDYEKPPESKEDPLVVYAVSAGYKWFLLIRNKRLKQ